MSIRHIFAAVLATLSMAVFAAVDVNQASQAELESVKGIGPSLSAKIMAARQQAQFKDWADMVDRVGGVGPGNAARFSQAGLTVAGVSYTAADAAKPAADKPAKPSKNAQADKPVAQGAAKKAATP